MILPDLNFTIARGGMTTVSAGFLGLRPTRCLVSRVVKTPNSRNSTPLPLASASVMPSRVSWITEKTEVDPENRTSG